MNGKFMRGLITLLVLVSIVLLGSGCIEITDDNSDSQPTEQVNNTTVTNVTKPVASHYDSYNFEYWKSRLNS
jgi:hypothetical protein